MVEKAFLRLFRLPPRRLEIEAVRLCSASESSERVREKVLFFFLSVGSKPGPFSLIVRFACESRSVGRQSLLRRALRSFVRSFVLGENGSGFSLSLSLLLPMQAYGLFGVPCTHSVSHTHLRTYAGLTREAASARSSPTFSLASTYNVP